MLKMEMRRPDLGSLRSQTHNKKELQWPEEGKKAVSKSEKPNQLTRQSPMSEKPARSEKPADVDDELLADEFAMAEVGFENLQYRQCRNRLQ